MLNNSYLHKVSILVNLIIGELVRTFGHLCPHHKDMSAVGISYMSPRAFHALLDFEILFELVVRHQR